MTRTKKKVLTDNPYWDEVKDVVAVDPLYRRPIAGGLTDDVTDYSGFELRHKLVKIYSWTITDPVTVEFIARHSGGQLVDPMSGTGYWSYVLQQLGIDVASYDKSPMANKWHGGQKLWVPIRKLNGIRSVLLHPDRPLLLSWPPYGDPAGHRILRAYRGDLLIYIGEHDGCCGDGNLREQLEDEWEEVDSHTPIQWFGLHDVVTVHVRRKREAVARGI